MESQKILTKLETCEPKKNTHDTNHLPMARKGYGSKGRKIQLLTNHLRVSLPKNDGLFYHYSVCPSHSHHIFCLCSCEEILYINELSNIFWLVRLHSLIKMDSQLKLRVWGERS